MKGVDSNRVRSETSPPLVGRETMQEPVRSQRDRGGGGRGPEDIAFS